MEFGDIEVMMEDQLISIDNVIMDLIKRLYDFDHENISIIIEASRDMIYIMPEYSGKMPKVGGTLDILFKYFQTYGIGFFNNTFSDRNCWQFEVEWEVTSEDFKNACIKYEKKVIERRNVNDCNKTIKKFNL